MKRRCRDSTRDGAKYYVGRGVTYDPQWEHFEGFLADMGIRPEGMTLDRIDAFGDYTKTNCRWATPTVQTRNRLNSLTVTIDGQTKALVAWAEARGIKYSTVHRRLSKGWPVEAALSLSPHCGKPGRLRGAA